MDRNVCILWCCFLSLCSWRFLSTQSLFQLILYPRFVGYSATSNTRHMHITRSAAKTTAITITTNERTTSSSAAYKNIEYMHDVLSSHIWYGGCQRERTANKHTNIITTLQLLLWKQRADPKKKQLRRTFLLPIENRGEKTRRIEYFQCLCILKSCACFNVRKLLCDSTC